MSHKTEEFLLFLCYAFDHFLHPTIQHVGESYEGWEYRNRHLIRSLRREGLLEAAGRGPSRWVRPSPQGRLVAAGGFDPTRYWEEPWDGVWRMVTFDVPAARRKARKQILHWLKGRGYGRLQLSVWVHVRRVESLPSHWECADNGFGFVASLESRCPDPVQNAAIRSRAWDFDRINRGYRRFLDACDTNWGPKLSQGAGLEDRSATLWEERSSWQEVASADPFLPRKLWPETYLGPQAWRRHCEFYHLISRETSVAGS